MIQPVNALTPKVLYKGETAYDPKESVKRKTRKRLALANAAGISMVLGAATTAIARSNTSSWRHAGYFGVGASLVSMMFLAPGFLYKSGINTTKQKDGDVFAREAEMPKKILADAGSITNTAKNSTKAVIKSLPKV